MNNGYLKYVIKISTAAFAVLIVFLVLCNSCRIGEKNGESENDPTSDLAVKEIMRLMKCELQSANDIRKLALSTFLTDGEHGKSVDLADADIDVDLDILGTSGGVISFVIEKESSILSPYGKITYYNIDRVSGKHLTLRDVLGHDYKRIVCEKLAPPIEDMRGTGYLNDDIDVMDLINEDRMYYLTDSGSTVVIVFDVGEIALDSAGLMEFRIDIST